MTVVYRVLARKYRPTTLADLVGQDLLVQTLTKAIQNNRLPHAFLLHGIRGVGKTTTARIIARVLNCLNNHTPSGQAAVSCGHCASCKSLTEDRHLDVIEIDAASRTGVDDIREIIESSRYKAVTGRYKIFIIDEVHMLSKSAFNALLKTLEEPPAHVKFIFATTEIRKIPDTILSRCMRFDLKRMEPTVLVHYLQTIAEREGCVLEPQAAMALARAADGSMRDGLSLLDQAIALSMGQNSTLENQEPVLIATQTIHEMLGLVNQQRLFELLKSMLEGQTEQTLKKTQALLQDGADPQLLLQDLLNIIYSLICLKTAPQFKQEAFWSEEDRKVGMQLVEPLSTSALMSIWQALLKSCSEVNLAPIPAQALEMAVLRVCYLTNLPSLESIITQLKPKLTQTGTSGGTTEEALVPQKSVAAQAFSSAFPIAEQEVVLPAVNIPPSFEELVFLISQAREPMVYSHLLHDVEIIDYQPGEMTFYLKPEIPATFLPTLQKILQTLTHRSWKINLSPHPGQGSIKQQQEVARQQLTQKALEHPVVKSFQQAFPEAVIKINESS